MRKTVSHVSITPMSASRQGPRRPIHRGRVRTASPRVWVWSLCALLTCVGAASSSGCRGPRAPEAADAGATGLRALPPVVRHLEAPWPLPRGYVAAAAHLSAGEVASRGWFHLTDDGVVRRLPAEWGIPTDATVVTSEDGRTLAWVERDGSVWRVRAPSLAGKPALRGGAQRVGEGADPTVVPLFVGGGPTLLFARPDGMVVRAGPKRTRVLWKGASARLSDLALDVSGGALVAVVGGESLAVVDVALGRGHSAYRTSSKGARLFGPRFGPDGALFVRERRQSTARLLRVPATGGDVVSVPLPAGTLRAFEVRTDGTLWLGLARRGKGLMLGEVVQQRTRLAEKPQNVRIAVFPRTLPWPRPACGNAFVVVEEDGRFARLVRVDAGTGASRIVSPPDLRLMGAAQVAVICGEGATR